MQDPADIVRQADPVSIDAPGSAAKQARVTASEPHHLCTAHGSGNLAAVDLFVAALLPMPVLQRENKVRGVGDRELHVLSSPGVEKGTHSVGAAGAVHSRNVAEDRLGSAVGYQDVVLSDRDRRVNAEQRERAPECSGKSSGIGHGESFFR
ncbi:hypothetical protein [Microbacterium sp. AK009]|uniref:hypothetical protein n=1 Tax=Microbacterium sp. AK009 TaxID=2723068 RepID=UPI001C54A374|nr:hypothetical protein [Microbacterium sp. AK009]